MEIWKHADELEMALETKKKIKDNSIIWRQELQSEL